MPFVYLIVTIKLNTMITSIEIAKILQNQHKDIKKNRSGFDSAIVNLGVTGRLRKKDKKRR
ncbi:MAG: phage regulator Rha-like protein [Crocinitomicaceae bacterium]|jgi:phage regulator Rha-like protein